MDEFKAYVGYVNGKPHVERVLDEYGECWAMNVYRSRKDAKKRYQDVRLVKMKVAEGKSVAKGNDSE